MANIALYQAKQNERNCYKVYKAFKDYLLTKTKKILYFRTHGRMHNYVKT